MHREAEMHRHTNNNQEQTLCKLNNSFIRRILVCSFCLFSRCNILLNVTTGEEGGFILQQMFQSFLSTQENKENQFNRRGGGAGSSHVNGHNGPRRGSPASEADLPPEMSPHKNDLPLADPTLLEQGWKLLSCSQSQQLSQ